MQLKCWHAVGNFQWAGQSNDTIACNVCPPGTYGLVLHKLHKGHLPRHERSLAHRIALVGPGNGQCELRRQQAPTAEHCRDAWHALLKGTPPHAGLDGVGKGHKLVNMQACLAEALRLS